MSISKRQRYLKSLLLQVACSAVIISLVALLLFLQSGKSFPDSLYSLRRAYGCLPYSIVYDALKPSMTAELNAMCRVYGFILRIMASLLISLLSIRFRFRYALAVEIILTVFSFFLYITGMLASA